MGEDSAQPRRWYYELVVDQVDPFLTPEPTHLRVGWACTEGYLPRPTGGDALGSNGVGDDLCSFGFDGLHLWSGKAQVFVFFNQSCQRMIKNKAILTNLTGKFVSLVRLCRT